MAHILYLEDDRVIREVVCEYLLLQDYEVDLADWLLQPREF